MRTFSTESRAPALRAALAGRPRARQLLIETPLPRQALGKRPPIHSSHSMPQGLPTSVEIVDVHSGPTLRREASSELRRGRQRFKNYLAETHLVVALLAIATLAVRLNAAMAPKKSIQVYPVDDAQVAAEIGRRVRARREAIGISQEQLAHMTGLHYSTVSHIERGNRGLRVISILRLAEGLECDPGDLVGGIGAPPRDQR